MHIDCLAPASYVRTRTQPPPLQTGPMGNDLRGHAREALTDNT
jgi:hypothetical protein